MFLVAGSSTPSFLGEISGGIGSKCQQFSQVIQKKECFKQET